MFELPIPGLRLRNAANALHLSSEQPLRLLASAVVGGGALWARDIINMHVDRFYASDTPAHDLERCARELGISGPFCGMMTAVQLDDVQIATERDAHATVVAIVTAGVGNAIAAGLSDPAAPAPGTINILLVADACLSDAAQVNAVITATEAKTLALFEAGVRAPHGGPASGTSTDAIVIASTERGMLAEYAGPIAPIGVLMARAVRRAVLAALAPKGRTTQPGTAEL